MNVTFYINNSDEDAVRKSLAPIKTVPARLKENSSMLNPTIELASDAISSWNRVNYMYIDTFNRYYFIEPSSTIAETGGMIVVGGRIDPLMSNQSAILSLNCVVLRQEHKYNLYYQDDKLSIRSQKTFIRKMIGSLPNVTTNVLTVDGG